MSNQSLDLSRRCDSIIDTIITPYKIKENSLLNENSPQYMNVDEFLRSYQYRQMKETLPHQTYVGSQQDRESCNLSPFPIGAMVFQQRITQHTPPVDKNSLADKLDLNSYPIQMIVGRDGKLCGPFNIYPEDPLGMALVSLADVESDQKYGTSVINNIFTSNGGQSNSKMRRTTDNDKPNHNNSDKDSEICERERRKNNVAVKRCRNRKRVNDEMMILHKLFT